MANFFRSSATRDVSKKDKKMRKKFNKKGAELWPMDITIA